MQYMSANQVLHEMMDVISKNGNYMISICQRGDGSVDDELKQILKEIGAWMQVHGEAIYGSRPFEIANYSEECFFLRNHNCIYMINFAEEAEAAVITHLGRNSATCGKITKVTVLETGEELAFEQTEEALKVLLPAAATLKIEQDKHWINDDDKGVRYEGWYHVCNRESGDYNNDCHFSEVEGENCTFEFEGSGISYYAYCKEGYGSAEVYIDDEMVGSVDLSAPEQAQKRVFTQELPVGKHSIRIVNAGKGIISVDAFEIR